jgi:hypothetical protein
LKGAAAVIFRRLGRPQQAAGVLQCSGAAKEGGVSQRQVPGPGYAVIKPAYCYNGAIPRLIPLAVVDKYFCA